MNKDAEEVDSPCVRRCCLDQHDICMGCFRSLTEITGWHSADKAGRLQILDKAKQRQIQTKR